MKHRTALSSFLVVILAAGCRSVTSGDEGHTAGATPDHDTQELALFLKGVTGEFAFKVTQASNQILAESSDPATRRATLNWRLSVIALCRSATFNRNPKVAFLDVWGIAAQMTYGFEQGDYKDVFGEGQSIAVATCKDLEAAIERVGSSFLAPDDLAAVRKDVREFAVEHSLGEFFTATLASSGQEKQLSSYAKSIIDAPLSAINPFGGVDKTAQSIHEVSVVGDRFADIADEAPRRVRWETELLLLNASESQAGQALLGDLHSVSDSAASLARTASTLPADLRAQVARVLDDLDQKQAGLQGTLKEAQTTIEDVDGALVQAALVGDSIDKAAQSITRMGATLESTIEAVTAMLKELEGPPKAAETEPREPPTPAEPFELADVGEAADKLTVTLRELHAVVAEVRTLAQPGELDPLLQAVDSTALRTMNHLTLRLGALVLLVLLAAIAYKLVVRRVVRTA